MFKLFIFFFFTSCICVSDLESQEEISVAKECSEADGEQCVVEDPEYRKRFERFLEKYGENYGYNGRLDQIRESETPHLENSTYLDFTGSGLHIKSQITNYAKMLTTELHGNAHSTSPSALLTDSKVEAMRERIVKFFNTNQDDYSVIFTSGATGSLKLVAESFPFEKNSLFMYTKENHNSVLGIRELAKENGGSFRAMNDDEIERIINTDYTKEDFNSCTKTVKNLFSFPGESNFSGKKFDLNWINTIINERKRMMKPYSNKELGCGEYYVLLDAAAFVPTNKLDLSKYPADFVSISFYKMFGHPTGIGCLLVKNELKDMLRKKYWSGGTVEIVDCDTSYCRLKEKIAARYEEGTINFLSIAGLKFGFDVIEEIGIENINNHVSGLTQYLYNNLISLKHSNGKSVVEVYGNHEKSHETQGGIISFNIKDENGDYVVHSSVMDRAARKKIHIRAGQHCNPGGAKTWIVKKSIEFFKNWDEVESCGSDHKTGQIPTGSIRVSLGYITNFKDIDTFIQFVKNYFCC